MMILTKKKFLSEIAGYLGGHSPFLAVRRFVFQYFEAEKDIKLSDELDLIFEVILPYLHDEESFGDPDRDLRLQRVYQLLSNTQAFSKEQTVFAIEFDKIRELAKKADDKRISDSVYADQISKLSPCNLDCGLIMFWANQHLDEKEPVLEKMNSPSSVAFARCRRSSP